MKENSKRSKKQTKSRIRSMISAAHVLIAVVAIIECLILISFTTYSWIETASSLIIKTGHKYLTDDKDTRIPIANALNYKFVVNNSTPSMSDVADLNNYFSYSGESSTQNLYRFSRASSPDGKKFFFKTTGGTTAYREGDIIDSNVNYTHFDFVVANTGAAKDHKLKFYFNTADVFSVANDTSNLSATDLTTVRNAMRISFQTGNGTPKIYSMTGTSTTAINTAAGGTTSVTAAQIQADQNQKLFTVGKNSEQSISVRIWLESQSTGLSAISGTDLAGLNITVNLQLTYAENDYDFLYFDDYTFSNTKTNLGGHLTEDNAESDSYRMYFVYSEGTTKYYYPMTKDNSGSNVDANCWVTCDASGTASSTVPDITARPFIANLTTESHVSLSNSYFAYGAYPKANVNVTTAPPSTPLYTWKLNGAKADSSGELRYSAYSVTKTANTTAGTYGVGGWAYNTPLTMVYFRDLATGLTNNSYNGGGTGVNFKYITADVNAASDTGDGNRSNVIYVNTSASTAANNTATMFYEKSADNGNGLFKSWIPTDWIENKYINFVYCPGGYFANARTTWANSTNSVKASKARNSNDYIYTGLGYSNNVLISATTNKTGIGCWNAIESEPVYFSTELIDNVVTDAFRYQIGVNINNNGVKYYNLIPDETNMKFYAYVPVPGTNTDPASDYSAGQILFRSYASVGGAQNGSWYGNLRKGSRTYHPVLLNTSTATSGAPKGYWNISVIVDGTYEHFFWDTRVESDPTDDGVLGTFSYNTTGHEGTPSYTDITPNKLDEYRWYVPLDGLTAIPEFVYFKWEPYTGTVFKYSQNLNDGIYVVITEAADTTPTNAFS